MSTTQAKLAIINQGNTVFTTWADIQPYGKSSHQIDLSLSVSELTDLLDILQAVKRRAQQAAMKKQVKQIEQYADRLIDEMSSLSLVQQLCCVGKRILLPMTKRYFSRRQQYDDCLDKPEFWL